MRNLNKAYTEGRVLRLMKKVDKELNRFTNEKVNHKKLKRLLKFKSAYEELIQLIRFHDYCFSTFKSKSKYIF
jgi:hypothetical protein